MKIISHRGNLYGPDIEKENKPEQIDFCLDMGYDVEIDLRWKDHNFYLGHDECQYHVSMLWLVSRKDNLWIHCKDIKSLNILSNSPIDFNYFWHQDDSYTLTSKNIIWAHPNALEYTEKCVVVMPIHEVTNDVYGICTDFPTQYKLTNT